jgi:hypothetical protein
VWSLQNGLEKEVQSQKTPVTDWTKLQRVVGPKPNDNSPGEDSRVFHEVYEVSNREELDVL